MNGKHTSQLVTTLFHQPTVSAEDALHAPQKSIELNKISFSIGMYKTCIYDMTWYTHKQPYQKTNFLIFFMLRQTRKKNTTQSRGKKEGVPMIMQCIAPSSSRCEIVLRLAAPPPSTPSCFSMAVITRVLRLPK